MGEFLRLVPGLHALGACLDHGQGGQLVFARCGIEGCLWLVTEKLTLFVKFDRFALFSSLTTLAKCVYFAGCENQDLIDNFVIAVDHDFAQFFALGQRDRFASDYLIGERHVSVRACIALDFWIYFTCFFIVNSEHCVQSVNFIVIKASSSFNDDMVHCQKCGKLWVWAELIFRRVNFIDCLWEEHTFSYLIWVLRHRSVCSLKSVNRCNETELRCGQLNHLNCSIYLK